MVMVPTAAADRHKDAGLSSDCHSQQQQDNPQIAHSAHLLSVRVVKHSPDQQPRRSLRADPLPRHRLLYVGVSAPRIHIGLVHRVPGLPGAGGRRVRVVRGRIEPEPNRRPVLEPLVTPEPLVAATNLMPAIMTTIPRCPGRERAQPRAPESSLPEPAY